MAEIKNPLRNVQVKFRRSKPITKIAVIAAIALSTVALLTLRIVQTGIEEETREMQEQIGQLLEENEELERKKQDVGSVQSYMEIAEEELGYVDPDTTFYEPQGSEDN